MTQDDERVQVMVRLPAALVRRVDYWSIDQPKRLTRTAAIAQLLREALDARREDSEP